MAQHSLAHPQPRVEEMSGYTSDELLGLRTMLSNSPSSANDDAVGIPEQSCPINELPEAAPKKTPIPFTFAHYECTSSLVVPMVANSPSPVQRAPADALDLFAPDSILSRLVRYGRGIANLNLYPATQRDIDINMVLWRAAQRGEYDPSDGNLILESNVLALAMPPELSSFLSAISEADFKTCMLEVLALMVDEEDLEDLHLVKAEIEPNTWNELMDYMNEQNTSIPRLDKSNPQCHRLLSGVDYLLQLCYRSPWDIDVYAYYIAPQDIAAILAENEKPLEDSVADMSISSATADSQPVDSQWKERPVPMLLTGPAVIAARYRLTKKNIVFWKLFRDWRRYREVLVTTLGMDSAQVSHLMMHSIAHGTQEEAWKRVEQVIACASTKGNLLSTLPNEIVQNRIAPHVLRVASLM